MVRYGMVWYGVWYAFHYMDMVLNSGFLMVLLRFFQLMSM